MFSELQPNCCWWKYTSFFTWQVENEPFKASFFHKWTTAEFTGTWRSLGMTAPQNLAAVTDVAFRSTHWKGYQSKLIFFHWKGGPCSFRGLLHCDDRRSHDELVAMDFSMIAVALTLSWLEWILTVRPVWLLFHHSCFVLFCCWT